MSWHLWLAGFVLVLGPPAARKADSPVRAKKPGAHTLVTYRFTAKITNNGGVTPFKVGSNITGEFTYDLNGKNVSPREAIDYARYESGKNQMVFKYGSLRCKGYGRIRLNVRAGFSMEHFQIVTNDLAMAKGWCFILPKSGRKNRSRTFGIVLQNAPTRSVLSSPRIPRTLKLADFANTRELRLDFYFGVRFPGESSTDEAFYVRIL